MNALAARRRSKEQREFKRMEPRSPMYSAHGASVANVAWRTVRRTEAEEGRARWAREDLYAAVSVSVRTAAKPSKRASRVFLSYSNVTHRYMKVAMSMFQRLESERFLTTVPDPFTLILANGSDPDASRCASRLLHLLRLPNDWYDDESCSPAIAALCPATVLLGLVPRLVPIVSIFPTYSGGVMFEYEHDEWNWSVEFQADGEVELHGVAQQGEEEFPLQEFSCIEDALDTIRQHAP